MRSFTKTVSLPATFAITTLYSAYSSSSFVNSPLKIKPNPPLFCSLSCSSSSFNHSVKDRIRPDAASFMDSTVESNPSVQPVTTLPELMTEFMVDMKCEGCVSAVKDKLLRLDGVKSVDVDLSNQVVRILGSLPVKTMADALEHTGRKARLIGQGNPHDFLVSAAVAEFKGPVFFGVVRIAQVNMELARIDANFSGLSPGKHGWAINEFGDLTRGAESTGKIYNSENNTSEKPLGDLGTLETNDNGEANFSGAKPMLRVADLIGRSIVIYETEDKSDKGIAAAVIARSAGVGQNYKKLCTCDGVTIWESS